MWGASFDDDHLCGPAGAIIRDSNVFIAASNMKLATVQDAQIAEAHRLRHGLMLGLALECNWLALESENMMMETDMTVKEGGQ